MWIIKWLLDGREQSFTTSDKTIAERWCDGLENDGIKFTVDYSTSVNEN